MWLADKGLSRRVSHLGLKEEVYDALWPSVCSSVGGPARRHALTVPPGSGRLRLLSTSRHHQGQTCKQRPSLGASCPLPSRPVRRRPHPSLFVRWGLGCPGGAGGTEVLLRTAAQLVVLIRGCLLAPLQAWPSSPWPDIRENQVDCGSIAPFQVQYALPLKKGMRSSNMIQSLFLLQMTTHQLVTNCNYWSSAASFWYLIWNKIKFFLFALWSCHLWWLAEIWSWRWSVQHFPHLAPTSWYRCGIPASLTARGRQRSRSCTAILFWWVLLSRWPDEKKDHPHPFAVQRACPFSFLGDKDHAAPLFLLLALPKPDLGVTHRHHQILGHAHTPAGALEGEGSGRLGRQIPERCEEKMWSQKNDDLIPHEELFGLLEFPIVFKLSKAGSKLVVMTFQDHRRNQRHFNHMQGATSEWGTSRTRPSSSLDCWAVPPGHVIDFSGLIKF